MDAWLATLRAAARPMDTVELHSAAQRIAERAQRLTGGRATFHLISTSSGVRISAMPPSPLAQRALDRAVDEQMDELRGRLGTQARERLISG